MHPWVMTLRLEATSFDLLKEAATMAAAHVGGMKPEGPSNRYVAGGAGPFGATLARIRLAKPDLASRIEHMEAEAAALLRELTELRLRQEEGETL